MDPRFAMQSHLRRTLSASLGTITINSQRNAVKPAVVLELRDRKQVYKETIQPATEMGLRRKGEERADLDGLAIGDQIVLWRHSFSS